MTAAGSTAGGGSARFVVPFLRNPGFVGRDDDLAEIHALLQRGQAVEVRPVAASGMGGIGKTQLAVEYAYRYAGEYPGGIFWVNAANDWVAERFGVEDGLASTDTWGDVARRIDGRSLPEDLKADDPFVCIHDPATGTGAFVTAAPRGT